MCHQWSRLIFHQQKWTIMILTEAVCMYTSTVLLIFGQAGFSWEKHCNLINIVFSKRIVSHHIISFTCYIYEGDPLYIYKLDQHWTCMGNQIIYCYTKVGIDLPRHRWGLQHVTVLNWWAAGLLMCLVIVFRGNVNSWRRPATKCTGKCGSTVPTCLATSGSPHSRARHMLATDSSIPWKLPLSQPCRLGTMPCVPAACFLSFARY